MSTSAIQHAKKDDLYTTYLKLKQQLDFLQVQEDYIKVSICARWARSCLPLLSFLVLLLFKYSRFHTNL